MNKYILHYYAHLKDEAKMSEEKIESNAQNPLALYKELQKHHGFTLNEDSLKVSVNDEIVDWDYALKDGDTIIYLPPVSGGQE